MASPPAAAIRNKDRRSNINKRYYLFLLFYFFYFYYLSILST